MLLFINTLLRGNFSVSRWAGVGRGPRAEQPSLFGGRGLERKLNLALRRALNELDPSDLRKFRENAGATAAAQPLGT
jgi:hypothetical protein